MSKECIRRIIDHSPVETEILVIDDASSEGIFEHDAPELASRVRFIRNENNLGFVKSANLGFESTGNNDVVLVNSDVFVVSNWVERLHADAYRSDLIATVTAMSDRGSIASVNLGDRDLVGCSISELQDLSNYLDSLPQLPPATIPVGVGHCLYIKRIAIQAIGYFSEEFSPGYGEEVDFCMRAVQAGFIHTMSNSVIVQHLEGKSFGVGRNEIKRKHQLLIDKKYPFYMEYISTYDAHSDVQKTVFLRALTHLHGIRVVIDGRRISKTQNGTAIVSFEMAKCMSETKSFKGSVKLLLNSDALNIQGLDSSLKKITKDDLDLEVKNNGKLDVFLMPSQVDYEGFFSDARTWAHRTIILQLDFIAFDNPFYHESIEGFRRYQNLALMAGQKVDRILYNSEFIATESVRALQSDDLNAACGSVVGNGIEHIGENHLASKKNQSKPQIGIFGTSYHHKNRIVGLSLVRKLQEEFPGAKLHLIGLAPPWGGSEDAEAQWLTDNEELKDLVTNHGGVTETQKRELLDSIDLLLVPSLSEGFGLAPFDGLPFGVPAIFPKLHSTFELLPNPPFHLSLVDQEATYNAVVTLLKNETARNAQLDYLIKVKEGFTWTATGNQVSRAIQEVVLELPRLPSAISRPEIITRFIHEIRNEDLNIRVAYRALGQTRLLLRLIPMHSKRRRIVNRILAPKRFWV